MVQVVGLTMQEPDRADVERMQRALDHTGEMDVDDVCLRIKKGQAQLWLVKGSGTNDVYASALTELVEYPRLTAVRVIALEGVGMVRWQEALVKTLYGFARAHGASRVEAICRPGLEKIMKPLGFSKKFVCLFKEVPTNGQERGND